jgi:phosphate transport system substrate-binding protein
MLRLLLLLLPLLPLTALADSGHLRVQGSNTIGAALLPALVQGQLWAQQATDIQQSPGAVTNETVITARDAQGQALRIDVAAHGSSTGFTALGQG